jgi:hypothetical protein
MVRAECTRPTSDAEWGFRFPPCKAMSKANNSGRDTMDNPLIYKLVEELRLQGRFASLAWQELPKAVQANDPERAFLHVQSLLTHAAQISKLLWPAAADSRERGERLCHELGVGSPSPLELRDLRALLDHYDERLVQWAGASEHAGFVALNLMPLGTLEGFRGDTFHRALDPETFRGAIQGVTFDLTALIKAIQSLDRAAERWLKSHRPW